MMKGVDLRALLIDGIVPWEYGARALEREERDERIRAGKYVAGGVLTKLCLDFLPFMEVLAAKYDCFFELLRLGDLVAWGLGPGATSLSEVPRGVWSSDDWRINFSTGGLWQVGEAKQPRFTLIELRRPVEIKASRELNPVLNPDHAGAMVEALPAGDSSTDPQREENLTNSKGRRGPRERINEDIFDRLMIRVIEDWRPGTKYPETQEKFGEMLVGYYVVGELKPEAASVIHWMRKTHPLLLDAFVGKERKRRRHSVSASLRDVYDTLWIRIFAEREPRTSREFVDWLVDAANAVGLTLDEREAIEFLRDKRPFVWAVYGSKDLEK
ncbi:hypothetical protein RZS28_04000 [Methylocapsa polymorpha]|uniref:Uncharacterized protein n=1 Tax=Methylocapsa polymorpha TaxID=3080828 RepID=A0ABZ0HUS8_9HYPH|nr:hypothetical protein RZS28_04000 [Methylocapsa sp. RX1]